MRKKDRKEQRETRKGRKKERRNEREKERMKERKEERKEGRKEGREGGREGERERERGRERGKEGRKEGREEGRKERKKEKEKERKIQRGKELDATKPVSLSLDICQRYLRQDVKLVCLAVGALRNLMLDSPTNRCKVAEADGLPILTQLYFTSTDTELKQQCLGALKNLVGNSW